MLGEHPHELGQIAPRPGTGRDQEPEPRRATQPPLLEAVALRPNEVRAPVPPLELVLPAGERVLVPWVVPSLIRMPPAP